MIIQRFIVFFTLQVIIGFFTFCFSQLQNKRWHGKKVAIAVRTEVAPQIDGYVDPLWLKAPVQGDFVQRYPNQGQKTMAETRFSILYDDHNLYILFIMADPNPWQIPARLVERDYQFYPDDSINFYLDTFNDNRKAYYFSTNPRGVEQDGLISENGARVDMSWDCVYSVAARRNKYGWVAEFAIPFKSLRFDNSRRLQIWGFNAWRIRKENREISYWSLVDQNYRMFRLDKGGVIVGIDQHISPGKHLDFLPYARVQQNTLPQSLKWKYGTGFDVRYSLTSDITLNLTFNPDFGQVEIDEEQINLDKRFELYLPEKRPFFLENTNLFQLPIQTFYSRRIGADADIKGGLKLTGKSGPYSFGVIGVATGDWKYYGLGDPKSGPPEEIFSVFRLQRDIFRNSNVGILVTGVDKNWGAKDYSYNRSASLDWNIYLGEHQFFTGQVVQSAQSGPGGEGRAARLTLGHYDQNFMIYLDGFHYDPDFEVNGTGFFLKLPNKGHSQGLLYLEAHPFVNKRFLRSWGVAASLAYIKETQEKHPGFGIQNSFWLEFPDQSKLTFYVANYQDVETDYRTYQDIVYKGTDASVSFRSDIGKPVSVRIEVSQNRHYYFQTYSLGYDRGAALYLHLKPISNAFLEIGYQRRQFFDNHWKFMPKQRIGQNDVQLWTFRSRYLFTKTLFSRVFVQFTNGAEQLENTNPWTYYVYDRLSANVLLGWRFLPGSAAYLVYTEEWDDNQRKKLVSANRVLFFKLSYLFSF